MVTFIRKLGLLIINIFICILWFVDIVTSRFLLKIYKKSLKFLSVIISIFFFIFLIYSYKTKSVARIADGYFSNFFEHTQVHQTLKKESPVLVGNGSPPYVTAKSFLVADKNNSKILYSKNGTQKQPPASTAKLMTALVVLDIYDLTEIIEVPEICTKIDSTKAWLPVKTRFSVRDLILSMLIGSAGDSACVLANSKLPYDNFVSLMNRKASLIGLLNTHFSNPIGLDDADGQNYSTVEDLYVLSRNVMQNPVVSEAVKMQRYALKSEDNSFENTIYSTNQLLYEIPNTLGIKTGTTESAGEVFVYEYADDEKDLIVVVMGSQDRFTDTKNLLYWALSSYSWKK